MANVIKDIELVLFDVTRTICNIEEYKKDLDRGVNVNATHEFEGVTNAQKVESLLEYATDAVHDMDEVRDQLKSIQNLLEGLLDDVEFEQVANKAKGI